MIFQTSRILARHLDTADVDDLHAVYGDREAMRWVGDGEPLDRTSCAHWVSVTRANYLKYGYGMSALVDRESEQVVGFCGIVHPGGQPEPEIKYALKRDCWGQGFATEAVRAMLDYGVREFHLSRIMATVAPENSASMAVLKKVGMEPAEDRKEADGTITRVFLWRPGPSLA